MGRTPPYVPRRRSWECYTPGMSTRLPKSDDELRQIARAMEIHDAISKDVREIRRMRKLGASDFEISIALGIPEELVAMTA